MIPEAIPDELAQMELQELYAMFNMIETEDIEDKDKKRRYTINAHKIIHGIRIPAHIEYLINELYRVWAHNKTVVLKYGVAYDLAEFFTEIRQRENLIRTTILENQDEGTTEPR